MGACLSNDDEDNANCVICNEHIITKYIYCQQCNVRMHYICLQRFIPNLNACIHCNNKAIQFIDLGRNSLHESLSVKI